MQFFEFDLKLIDRGKLPFAAAPHLPRFLSRDEIFPDLSKIRVGSVVLFAPRSPSAGQNLIVESQMEKVSPKHAQWTHVGIYLGDYLICEATPKGVVVSNVLERLHSDRIRFRYNPALDDVTSAVVAIKSLLQLNKKYDWSSVRDFFDRFMKGQSLRPRLRLKIDHPEQSFICSSLCTKAYKDAKAPDPFSNPTDAPSPCDFSITGNFHDYDHTWLRVAD